MQQKLVKCRNLKRDIQKLENNTLANDKEANRSNFVYEPSNS